MTVTGGAHGVSVERRRMVAEMFTAIDAKDVDGLLRYLAPDASQRFGNAEPLRGHDEIRAGNVAFLDSIASIRHEVTGLWESEEGVICRLQVTYTRHDGRSVTIPGVTMFREEHGLIVEYEVYFDVAPVFAETPATGGAAAAGAGPS